ncbi:MAG: hypothetical protein NZM38_11180 [Cytophagales bacterium]|nr:hypothetical protein [Cytophagales bacterium]MDW8385318.1 hypothetical protein [Flammeovirgaceae bacterium]
MKKKIRIGLFCIIGLVACGGKNEILRTPFPLTSSERSVFQDENSGEGEFDELSSIDNEAMNATSSNSRAESEFLAWHRDTIRGLDSAQAIWCANILHNQTERKILIDFGSGCLGKDGRFRKGKISIEYIPANGRDFVSLYAAVGNKIITTYDKFEVDGINITATRTSTYKGDNTVEVKVEGGIIAYPDGKKITWNSLRTRKQIAGMATRRWSDDRFLLNGNTEGITKDNIKFRTTLRDIIIDLTCPVSLKRFPTSGTRIVSFGERYENSRTFEFGNGDCDRKISLRTTDGKSTEITLD